MFLSMFTKNKMTGGLRMHSILVGFSFRLAEGSGHPSAQQIGIKIVFVFIDVPQMQGRNHDFHPEDCIQLHADR